MFQQWSSKLKTSYMYHEYCIRAKKGISHRRYWHLSYYAWTYSNNWVRFVWLTLATRLCLQLYRRFFFMHWMMSVWPTLTPRLSWLVSRRFLLETMDEVCLTHIGPTFGFASEQTTVSAADASLVVMVWRHVCVSVFSGKLPYWAGKFVMLRGCEY